MAWPVTVPGPRTDESLATPDVHANDHTDLAAALDEVARRALRWQEVLTGETTIPRDLLGANVSLVSGTLRLGYFTARKSENIAQVRTRTGTTAAAATPTLCRIGIYSEAGNGDLTLVASTANDTTLWAAASTDYVRNLSATWAKVAGQRYAWGALIVTGTTAPQLLGQVGGFTDSTTLAMAPRINGQGGTGLTDLPSSIVNASVTGSGIQPLNATLIP